MADGFTVVQMVPCGTFGPQLSETPAACPAFTDHLIQGRVVREISLCGAQICDKGGFDGFLTALRTYTPTLEFRIGQERFENEIASASWNERGVADE